jgi:hypothetical protein
VISVKTLVSLAGNPAHLCPFAWHYSAFNRLCAANGMTHTCVGDVGHGGKHVCRCGALRSVVLPR